MKLQNRNHSNWLALACLALLLAGCQGYAFSPESAVLSEISRSPMPGFSLELGSAQVLQNIELGQGRVVLVEFHGVSENVGPQACLFDYRVFRRFGGWATGGGGGGCSNEKFESQQVLTVGSGVSSGDGINDPGMSIVDGRVLDSAVTKVVITWNDGQEQEASIANNTYLAARLAQAVYAKVEAFDSEGKTLFSLEQPTPAPGKY